MSDIPENSKIAAKAPSPHFAQLGRNIDSGALSRVARHPTFPGENASRDSQIEVPKDLLREKAAPRRIDVPIAAARLAMRVEALRMDQVQLVPGSGHGDVEEAPLLDLIGAAAGHIRGDAAVNDAGGIEDILVGLEGAVGEVGLSQELPEVLDWVQFGGAGRQEEQGDVVWYLQFSRPHRDAARSLPRCTRPYREVQP